MKEIPVAFGANVRALREQRRWGVRELARKSGVSAATVSRLERDGLDVALSSGLQIAQALETTLDDLLKPHEHVWEKRCACGETAERVGETAPQEEK